MDSQTGMAKTSACVLEAGKRHHIPVIAIGGTVEETDALIEQGFKAVFPIQPGPVSLAQAMDKTFAFNQIKRTAEQIARLYQTFNNYNMSDYEKGFKNFIQRVYEK
jgi:glycerate kinase